MKYLFPILLLLVTITQKSAAQCEWDYKTVRLYSQSEVDSFLIKYPNCTELWHLIISNQYPKTDPILNLRGLDSLKTIGTLAIGGCDKLESLKGLENVTEIYSLAILDDVKINSLDELKGISHVDELTVWFDDLVPDLNILGNMRVLKYLRLEGNSSLEGYNIIEDDFALRIQDNNIKNDLRNLVSEGLNDFKLYLQGVDNFSFKGLNDFLQLEALTIQSCNYLNLSGLQNIKEVDNLYLVNCSLTKPIQEVNFRNLENVNSQLVLARIKSIKSLSSITPNLKYIGHGISLHGLDSLSSINILNSISIPNSDLIYNSELWSGSVGNLRLNITQNNNLIDCNGEFICRMIEAYPNEVNIANNANEECTYNYLVDYCLETSTSEVNLSDEIIVYPNPVVDELRIKSGFKLYGVSIYDLNGKLLLNSSKNRKVDLSLLESGVYMTRIESARGNYFQKIVKI